jgi:hypothetical protein
MRKFDHQKSLESTLLFTLGLKNKIKEYKCNRGLLPFKNILENHTFQNIEIRKTQRGKRGKSSDLNTTRSPLS